MKTQVELSLSHEATSQLASLKFDFDPAQKFFAETAISIEAERSSIITSLGRHITQHQKSGADRDAEVAAILKCFARAQPL